MHRKKMLVRLSQPLAAKSHCVKESDVSCKVDCELLVDAVFDPVKVGLGAKIKSVAGNGW